MKDQNKPFLFTRQLTLRTRLSKDDVLKIVENNTQEKGLFNTREFRGTIQENTFSLTRPIPCIRNVVHPSIDGLVEEKDTGTFITIKVSLSKLALILGGMISLGFFAGAVYNLSTSSYADSVADLVIALVLYLMNVGFFALEGGLGIKSLKKLLGAGELE